jgi:hypothetical protein
VVNAIRRVCTGERPQPKRARWLRGFFRSAGNSAVLSRHLHRVVSQAAKARNGWRS